MKFLLYFVLLLLSGCATLDPSEEAEQVLHEMNQAYKNKELDRFMSFVSPDYQGNRADFQLAVENDFAGFTGVEYRTSVFQTRVDKETGIYNVSVYYYRIARSPRYGIDNQSGETFLTFLKNQDGLKLVNMSYPALYGLIVP